VAEVLIIEDDDRIRPLLVRGLRDLGHTVTSAPTGMAGLQLAVDSSPDLVVLDLGLPDVDGTQVLSMLRAVSTVPVIIASARDDDPSLVGALDAGADDYVVKPFNPKELVARVRTRLRPQRQADSGILKVADLEIDVDGHQVRRGAQPIALTPLEFELLVTLASKPNQVFSREMLLEQVWGYHYKADTRLVNVHVQRLRSKVELDVDSPVVVTTVRGVGYRAGAPLA